MNFQEAKSKTLAQFIDMLMNGETDTMSKGDCVIRVLDMLQDNFDEKSQQQVSAWRAWVEGWNARAEYDPSSTDSPLPPNPYL